MTDTKPTPSVLPLPSEQRPDNKTLPRIERDRLTSPPALGMSAVGEEPDCSSSGLDVPLKPTLVAMFQVVEVPFTRCDNELAGDDITVSNSLSVGCRCVSWPTVPAGP